MGKNNNKKSKKRKAAAAAVDVEEKDLNRFAGSSGEEDNNEVEEEEPVEEEEYDENDIPVVAEEEEEEEPEDEEEEVPSDGEDEILAEEATGMANAMARILGTTVTSTTPVLGKTVTPLQRMARKEKQVALEAREKRKLNRAEHLTALHIPLSVATTRTTDGGSTSLVQELEQERAHRRVATRGVVALFNAISQHQQEAKAEHQATMTNADPEVKKMTKHGFLDMIKSKATKDGATAAVATSSKPQWNALKDDYLLNSSKMKDWDKASSEEEDPDEADPNEPVDDDWSDDEKVEQKPKTTSNSSSKKRRTAVQ